MSYEEMQSALREGRVYLGNAIFADQGHQRFVHFPKIIETVKPRSPAMIRILEVGSWAGGSLIAWDKAADHQCILTVVDQWKPYYLGPPRNTSDDPAYVMDQACTSGDIEALFLSNIKAAGISDRVTLIKGDSRNILPKLLPFVYDIIFIDGDHSYEFINADIENAKRLIRVGGVVCGDDLARQLPSVDGGHHRRQIALKNQFTNAENDGEGYHPGVTQAVWEHFGQVSNPLGLWAVQKTKDGWNVNVL